MTPLALLAWMNVNEIVGKCPAAYRDVHAFVIEKPENVRMHYLLIYDVVENYTELRKPHRPAHFEHAQKSFDGGELILAGALDEPVDGAVFVFRAAEPGAAARFAENDPYVRAGIVKSWRVRKWNTVLGDGAQLPKL